MSGNIDFDVGNYGVEELVSIIDAINKIPLSKADIIEITKKYIDKYDNKPKFKKFFQDVRIKLLNEKDRGINESIFSSTSLEKLKEEQIVGDRYKTMDGMLDETRNVPVELKFPNITSKPTHFIQGRLNPTHIDTTTKVVSFDSKDRPILDPIAVNCRDVDGNILVDNGNNGERLDSATNYTTTIDQINNVVQLSLSNVEIPHTWFVFSLSYGTNYFMTNHNNSPCIIEEGNYTSGDDIIDTINEAVDVDISRNLKFQYHSRQGRVSIKNEGLEPVTIKWYSPMAELAFCVEGGAIGQKIDYNLGWLLGFRLPEYTILPTDRIVS